ncbi:hypothetical protein [Desulfosarcina sp.]|uniref:hypothetical protein n=1 Tax=Desulfosarcina sp. TaxID=2027861 RepID=UPI0035641154
MPKPARYIQSAGGMNRVSNQVKHSHPIQRLLPIAALLAALAVACTANYGRLQRSNDVSKTFERYEVLADHAYYATGPAARPTAILAIHRSYTLKPGLWRSVDMTPELLSRLVDAMTDQLGFTPAILGGVIADPAGKQVGVWYSLYRRTTIRLEPENVIVVSLPTPDNDPFPMGGGRRPGMLR